MQLNPSIKHHLIIGVLLFVWGFIFAFFARPFEHGTMDLNKWLLVSFGFSFLFFLAYLGISGVQRAIFQRLGRWSLGLEILIYLLYYAIYTATSFVYYRSTIIDGFYNFQEFFFKIIINILLITTPIIVAARYFSLRSKAVKAEGEEEITIRGANKLDFLKIKRSALVCVSNTQNYVEIFYLEEGTLRTMLMRSSLKKMQADFDFLLQVHRSHLINPAHFKAWKDGSTIVLTQKELPVSKTYKSQLLSR